MTNTTKSPAPVASLSIGAVLANSPDLGPLAAMPELIGSVDGEEIALLRFADGRTRKVVATGYVALV